MAAEREARTDLVAEQARVIRAQLPTLLKRLQKIPDPRQPGKLKHALTSLMLFGLLCFANGMVIPLMSEFLDYREGDGERNKQDCEMRAFHRLTERIKHAFPRLPILLLLDGLYANGPVMQRTHDYHWQFMIVLKDDALPSVWREYRALASRSPNLRSSNNTHQQYWGGRVQDFCWVNDIGYEFGPNGRQRLTVHALVCDEQWQGLDEHGQIVTCRARHAWLSSRALRRENVHERANLAARYRWGIEAGFLVEKHRGYHYEHCFARHWDALRGYHYLMRLAHLLNTLARFAAHLAPTFRELGVRAFIHFERQSLSGPWFDLEQLTRRVMHPLALRLT